MRNVPMAWVWGLSSCVSAVVFGAAAQVQQRQQTSPSPNLPVLPIAEEPTEVPSRIEWRRLGPFGLNPRISAMVLYDDNITIRSATKRDDLIWAIAPGLSVTAGDRLGGTGRLLTFDYSQAIRNYGGSYLSSREWANENWLNLRTFARITTGLGLTFGYLDADQFPGQTYEQVLVRALYDLTGRIDLNASVGGEWRQYGGGGGGGFQPVFSLGASYWPLDRTMITVDGHRRNQNSAFIVGQNYVSTGLGISVRQQIGDRFFLTLATSYLNAEYEATRAGIIASRSDNYYLLRPSVDVRLGEHWTVGAFYQYRKNDSKGTGALGFANNQLGLQTAYSF